MPARDPHEDTQWTIKSLYTHLISIINKNEEIASTRDSWRKEALTAALAASEKAIAKAETASEKRFDGVNEFRALVTDQQRTLMPRAETEGLFKILHEKYEAIQKSQNDKLDKIEAEMLEIRASKQGSKEGMTWIIGIVGFILTLATLANLFI